MFPFVDACQGLERTVRDVARAVDKEVELIIEGGDLELDRSVLEGLKDPLNHLVRNAVDHGLETSLERQEAGKPAQGRITVSAALRGTQVEVIVADDGKGLDWEAIRLQARKQGLAEPSDDRAMAELIFHPGFSTAPIITHISGRGVGLDVVKSRAEALHGSIDVRSEPGRGTRFTLAVPLTLTTLRMLLVSAGSQIFALASTNVQKLLARRSCATSARYRAGRCSLWADHSCRWPRSPMHSAGRPERRRWSAANNRSWSWRRATGAWPSWSTNCWTNKKSWSRDLGPASGGPATSRVRPSWPSGRLALVLNVASLVRTALGRVAGPALARTPAGTVAAPKKRLLVVDDSITTRTLEKSILESAGYEVTTAVDGEDGWRHLQEHGADLLLSDVEMPRMNGFELTEIVRASNRFTVSSTTIWHASSTAACTGGDSPMRPSSSSPKSFGSQPTTSTCAEIVPIEAARFNTRTGSMPCGFRSDRLAMPAVIRLEHIERAGSFTARQCIDEDDRIPGIEQRIGQIEATNAIVLNRPRLPAVAAC